MVALRDWFDGFTKATGEKPTAIVFGVDEWDTDRFEDWGLPSSGVVHPITDVPDDVWVRDFDNGWGGNDSPNLCAWSPSWVLFSDNYDGAEGLCWVPRNPIDHSPIRPGGG